MPILSREFYDRSAILVTKELLGQRLVRIQKGIRMAGIICEVEAYQGEDDLGCHAHVGRTPRNEVMYGRPGHAYVYFTYGMHWLLNVVTEREGLAAAVLIRSIYPIEGHELMAENRSYHAFKKDWLNGPAKICQALTLDGSFNGVDLCDQNGQVFIESENTIPLQDITSSPRIGLTTVPEPWKSIPWRFEFPVEKIRENNA
ncbi:MAG: DNA-3-methyladenine glycosylase [Anaerolineaceae bacterium]|nr:DNA-3-methyladenine glycosylase [Anaerolineaceae bacterium]